MAGNVGKLSYFVRSASLAADSSRKTCPNCSQHASKLVERKAGVTALRRCDNCLLLFRTPIDIPEHAAEFYNNEYSEGFTTSLPSESDLAHLKSTNWVGEKDYSHHASVLRSLGLKNSEKLFDFGCSWGYGSYQLREAGFDVLSYEISRPRAAYGAKHLGVQLVDDFEAWVHSNPGSLDGFFSSHVLEHVPSPSHIIALARKALKPGGLFVCFVPNGSAACRATQASWSHMWGEVHPNFLDDVFLNAAVPDRPKLLGSSPIAIKPAEADFLRGSPLPAAYHMNDTSGSELFFAFRN